MKKIMLNTIIDGNEKQNVLDYETEIKPKFVPNAGDRLQIKSGCLLFFTVIKLLLILSPCFLKSRTNSPNFCLSSPHRSS